MEFTNLTNLEDLRDWAGGEKDAFGGNLFVAQPRRPARRPTASPHLVGDIPIDKGYLLQSNRIFAEGLDAAKGPRRTSGPR